MMSRAWSTTSVPPHCAQLRRSPSNCSVDPPYAPNCKPARFSNCPEYSHRYGFLELVAVATASLNFLKFSCFTRRLSASETVTK